MNSAEKIRQTNSSGYWIPLNRILVIATLLTLFVLSGLVHQTLYLLFPAVGMLTIYHDDFKVLKTGDVQYSLIVVALILAIFVIQSVFYFQGWFSFQGFLRYVNYFFLLVFVRKLHEKSLHFFFIAISMILFLAIPVGFYISVVKKLRYEFVFDHSNHLAYVCVLISYYFIKLFKGKKYIKLAAVALLGIIILFSKSTGGLLSYSILVLYSIFENSNAGRIKKLALIIPVVLVLIILVSLSGRFIEQLAFLEYYNLSFILERVEGHQAGGVGSGLWRIIHWLSILKNFFDEKLIKILFGLGIDTMTKGHYPYEFMITDPHNDFVKIFVEFGTIGFIIFLSFYRKLVLSMPKGNSFLIVTLVPMMLGNIIVNFPYALILVAILALANKNQHV